MSEVSGTPPESSTRREKPLQRFAAQESCVHRWLPREHVPTSHGMVWRTECARCGKYVARADHGDLSDLLTELDGDLSERLRMMAEERRRVEADSRNIVLP